MRPSIMVNGQHRGFAIPSVVFQDDARLPPLAYEVLLFGACHARGELRPEEILALGGPPSGPRLPGVETRDPAFGLPARSRHLASLASHDPSPKHLFFLS